MRPTDKWTETKEGQNYLFCDGSTFSASAYPKLAEALGGTTLPDLRNRFPKGVNGNSSDPTSLENFGSTPQSVMVYFDAGLPEIWGQFAAKPHSFDIGYPAKGAFRALLTGAGGDTKGDDCEEAWEFKASYCSPVYRDNCMTVQPSATALNFYIRAK